MYVKKTNLINLGSYISQNVSMIIVLSVLQYCAFLKSWIYINQFLQFFCDLRKVMLPVCNTIDFSGYWKPERNVTIYLLLWKKTVATLVSEKQFLHNFLVDQCCNEGLHEKYCKIGFYVIDKLSLILAWDKKERLPVKDGGKYFQRFPWRVVVLLVGEWNVLGSVENQHRPYLHFGYM